MKKYFTPVLKYIQHNDQMKKETIFEVSLTLCKDQKGYQNLDKDLKSHGFCVDFLQLNQLNNEIVLSGLKSENSTSVKHDSIYLQINLCDINTDKSCKSYEEIDNLLGKLEMSLLLNRNFIYRDGENKLPIVDRVFYEKQYSS